MKKSLRLLSSFIITLISLVLVASAGSIDIGVTFHTDNDVAFYTNTTFNFTNITVYSDSLFINNGNLTVYPSTSANITLDSLGEGYFNFTNNVTLTNITVYNGFANFSINDSTQYSILYRINDTVFFTDTANASKITFSDVPAYAWYIYGFAGGTGNFTLSGYIFNRLDLPIYQAKINFNGESNFTDAAGYYEFTGLADNEYDILIQAIGYSNKTDTVNVIGNQTYNATMSERRAGTVSMPGFSAISGIFILGMTLSLFRMKKKRSD